MAVAQFEGAEQAFTGDQLTSNLDPVSATDQPLDIGSQSSSSSDATLLTFGQIVVWAGDLHGDPLDRSVPTRVAASPPTAPRLLA
ncbi:hypothetical protein ABH922_004446 [Rhodococcus sp. 27YEA15]|uniref:hypothetical protein n=1 Tax=Rhodococcus sp. 27YEA15 TaxID=3156259 RepID=UPI003C7C1BA0